MWVPTTLRRRFLYALSEVDITVQRPEVEEPPIRACMVYIEGGEARMSESFRPTTAAGPAYWTHVRSLGAATSVAIEFDCIWIEVREVEGEYEEETLTWRFRPITIDEDPWVFYVRPDGSLLTRHGWAGKEITLASDGVSKVVAARGWKNVRHPQLDQGLVAIYIRDGEIRYRQYKAAEVGDEPHWHGEEVLDSIEGVEIPDNPVNIGAPRANDYRLLLLVQDDQDEIYLLGTERNWAGMGIPSETIDNVITDYVLDLNPIMFTVVGTGPFPTENEAHWKDRWQWGEHDAEYINSTITDYTVRTYWGGATQPISVENVESVATQTMSDITAGDGETTEFETGWYPVKENTETVELDGTEQTRDVDYTIDYDTGTITFTTAPGNGVMISASYDWYSWGHKIKVTFDYGIQNTEDHEGQVTVQDTLGTYDTYATADGDPWPDPITSFIGTREWLISTANFNESEGDITVSYTENGLHGEAEQEVGSFTESFTPTNLIEHRVLADPPEVEAIWNA